MAPMSKVPQAAVLVVILSRRAATVALFVVVLVCFFAALLVNGRALGDARIVALELDAGVWGEVENTLHGFTAEVKVSRGA